MNKNELTLSDMLQEFDEDYCAQDENRRLASEDMRFSVVPGGHWEGWLEDVYKDRTKLELDMVNIAVERFIGEFADNRVDVKYSPLGGETSEDDANLLQGIYRRDHRRGRGKISVLSVVSEMVRCGFGTIQLHPVYEDDESEEDDLQRVEFSYVPNAYNNVVFDCNSRELDKSDASRAVRLYEYSTKAFKRAFPDKSAVTVGNDERKPLFSWSVGDSIFVAHRYDVESSKVVIHTFINPLTEEIKKIEDDDLELVENDLLDRGWEKTRSKKVTRRSVYKTVFSGAEILEPRRKISGSLIPLIPFYCYRSFVDGQELYWGLIRKMKDAQRLFDMEISQAAEISSTGSRDIPIIDPRSIQGYEAFWTQGNIYDKQYLPAIPHEGVNGTLSEPLVGVIPAARMSETSAAVLDVVSNYIKESTGGQDADISDVDLSGKAIRELVKRMNLNTRSININIELSTERLGDVYRSIASDIYSVPRLIGLLGEDGAESTEHLMQTAVDDSGRIVEKNNIRKMRFEVTSTVGQAYETQRNETVDTLRSLIAESRENQASSEYLPVLYASLLDNLTGTGLDPVKEFNRKKMLQLGLVEPADEDEQKYLQSLNQPSPQDELVKAAAQQQMAEAENLKAQAVERISKSELNRAKSVEAIENMKTKRIQALRDAIARPA